MKNYLHTLKKSEGVALLFTVLMTSGLLLIAIGIANVSYREASFSAESADSSMAFYASDLGMECARVFDKLGAFVSSPPQNLTCWGSFYPVPITVLSPNIYEINGAVFSTYCWRVVVNKNWDPDGSGPLSGYTLISSYGYNKGVLTTPGNYSTCNPDYSNPRLVVRGSSTNYP